MTRVTIVSISMDERLLQDVKEIQRNLRFSGRSEVIRSAIRMFSADLNEKRTLTGPLNCICLVTHDEDAEDVVTEVKHRFNRIIETHVHSKLGAGRCLEILVLKGDAKEVRELFRMFEISRRVDQVRLILPR